MQCLQFRIRPELRLSGFFCDPSPSFLGDRLFSDRMGGYQFALARWVWGVDEFRKEACWYGESLSTAEGVVVAETSFYIVRCEKAFQFFNLCVSFLSQVTNGTSDNATPPHMSVHPSRTVDLKVEGTPGGGLVHTRNWKLALRFSHSSSSGPTWTPNSIGDQRLGFRGGSRVSPAESPGAHGLPCLPEVAPSPEVDRRPI